MRFSTLCLGAFLSATWLQADVSLAPVFTDHAVVQRGQPVPVWGWADPGEAVTVNFDGQSAATVAASDGHWRVDLEPMAANATSQSLTVTGTNQITLNDVLIGDVWLCGGQSNMEWPLRNANDAEAEIAGADYPQIRHIKVARRIANQPITDLSGEWVTCTPETAGHFAAIGYFFARRLTRDLGVPVGLINSTWGGTPVESWLPSTANDDPSLAVAIASHQARVNEGILHHSITYRDAMTEWAASRSFAQEANENFDETEPVKPWQPGPSKTATVLYNGMIAPLPPYALGGVIWYQGEGNGGQPETYHEMFSALIAMWREAFSQPELPFYWAQLASWAGSNASGGNHTDWAFLREAQHETLALPHTGQAILMDVGEADDIHPRNKQAVGDRLARIALAQIHGRDIAYRGPAYTSVTLRNTQAIVNFEHATGLTTRDGEAPRGFEMAAADGHFVPATATIEGETILLQADGIESPRYVRYAWRRYIDANLQNADGLPAEPFRTDGN